MPSCMARLAKSRFGREKPYEEQWQITVLTLRSSLGLLCVWMTFPWKMLKQQESQWLFPLPCSTVWSQGASRSAQIALGTWISVKDLRSSDRKQFQPQPPTRWPRMPHSERLDLDTQRCAQCLAATGCPGMVYLSCRNLFTEFFWSSTWFFRCFKIKTGEAHVQRIGLGQIYRKPWIFRWKEGVGPFIVPLHQIHWYVYPLVN